MYRMVVLSGPVVDQLLILERVSAFHCQVAANV
jgi:hypothetical protein